MATDLRIRRATGDDAPAIAALHVASWRAAYRGVLDDAFLDALSVEQRTGFWRGVLGAAEAGVTVLVAEAAGAIVGFCSCGRTQDPDEAASTGALTTIYVAPERARGGIGSALLASAEEAMRDAGLTDALLWVIGENADARAFYERAGWRADGTERDESIGGRPVIEVRYRKTLS